MMSGQRRPTASSRHKARQDSRSFEKKYYEGHVKLSDTKSRVIDLYIYIEVIELISEITAHCSISCSLPILRLAALWVSLPTFRTGMFSWLGVARCINVQTRKPLQLLAVDVYRTQPVDRRSSDICSTVTRPRAICRFMSSSRPAWSMTVGVPEAGRDTGADVLPDLRVVGSCLLSSQG
jgi:hypothetical protein